MFASSLGSAYLRGFPAGKSVWQANQLYQRWVSLVSATEQDLWLLMAVCSSTCISVKSLAGAHMGNAGLHTVSVIGLGDFGHA